MSDHTEEVLGHLAAMRRALVANGLRRTWVTLVEKLVCRV